MGQISLFQVLLCCRNTQSREKNGSSRAELGWAGLGWAIATGDVCWVVDSVQASICGYVSGNTAANHLFCSFQLQLLELRELSVNTVVATSSPWQGFKSTSRLRSRIRGEI